MHTGIIDLHTNLVPANNFTSNKLYYCPIWKRGGIYYQSPLFFSIFLIVLIVSSLSFLGFEYWYVVVCSLIFHHFKVLLSDNWVCECVSSRYE